MRAHYLQHVPFEGLGNIEKWLDAKGYAITNNQVYQSTRFPDSKDIDLLIIMGGPMSVHDEAEFPWLSAEKEFIKRSIDSGVTTLGICLGAQLIADVTGGEIYPNSEKEIGWFPITGTTASNNVFSFPTTTTVFHWHGETFTLPDQATKLAESGVCSNQAFQLGDKVIGLQFHLETTPASAKTLVDHCGDELIPAQYIQDKNNILSVPADYYETIHHLMDEVLGYLHLSVIRN